MTNPVPLIPPDQSARHQALHPGRSILVQAPAGSGKTDLLTRRFLGLLATVDDPGQIVAITFTIAAAAEMRHRILSELEKAAGPSLSEPDAPRAPSFRLLSGERVGDHDPQPAADFSMPTLARRALLHSQARGWNLLDLPSQLRISTIDSFCRDLALQQPLLSGLGGGLGIAEQPTDLYRRAARQTLEQIGSTAAPALSSAIEFLLLWRDNNWQELEDLVVQMLSNRDRWMHDFLLQHDPDWGALRACLERPFANAVRNSLTCLSLLLDQVPAAREEALALARFACTQTDNPIPREVAELAEIPITPFLTTEELDDAYLAFKCLANLLLTGDSAFRKAVDKRLGFPADRKPEKARFITLIAALAAVPGLESALAETRSLPPARYTEEDWQIVRACFTVLRRAAAQLKIVFAESGAVDFIEVSQIAQAVLKSPDGSPSDAAITLADGIRHLLVDEFQDTSRRQHQLLAGLIAAWPDRPGRTCFLVGDPLQSIYFFRDADAELFPRVRDLGLEIPSAEPLLFDFVPLKANFRTTPPLVERLNGVFKEVFAAGDGSNVKFFRAEPFREADPNAAPGLSLHLEFVPQAPAARSGDPNTRNRKEAADRRKEEAAAEQVRQIVALIQSYAPLIQQARAADGKFRIAILARAKKSLVPIAQALREFNADPARPDSGKIPFRAVELEKLQDRPEVLDALTLARALLNPHDRVAWLGVLRAPWCGLSLADLHTLAGNPDDGPRTILALLAERIHLLSEESRPAAARVLQAFTAAPALRAAQPASAVGTWLQLIWLILGGDRCVDATARANLNLLWTCLDALPAGEQDVLGPALDAALDKLTALPDPDATSECGVQLMTIHKSKGLEFEIVIVPDLQARGGRGQRKLLSWLERGLPPPTAGSSDADEAAHEITEFLIAPIQPKGDDRGTARAWVDRVCLERESQETRRILYVAATRAREELHLFARPACKVDSNGDLVLAEPSDCLLATAWPAFEAEVRARFDAWKQTQQPTPLPSEAEFSSELQSLAASAETHLLFMPSLVPPPTKPTILHRLPADYRDAESSASPETLGAPSFPRPFAERVGEHEPESTVFTEFQSEPKMLGAPGLDSETWESTPYARHQGGQLSRSLGTAVHVLLQQLARLRADSDWPTALATLQHFQPRIAAQIRATGIDPSQASTTAAQALRLALGAANSPDGQWILSPHADAASEVRWTGLLAGTLRTVQVDRLFRAALTPQSEGQSAWWIVDYKTAHAAPSAGADPASALTQLRPLFAPQLETYAQVLRNLHGTGTPLRAGLYYPRMLLFDWWEIE